MNKFKKSSKGKGFRLSSKKLFLTYSRCDLDLNKAFALLKDKLESYDIKNYLLVRELHAPEINSEPNEPNELKLENSKSEYHIHVYIKLKNKLDTKNINFLHLEDGSEKVYKGHYLGAKNPDKVIEYCIKSLPNMDSPNVIADEYTRLFISNSRVLSYEEVMINLSEKGQIQQAMSVLREHSPIQYMKNHMTIERSLQNLYLKNKGFKQRYDLSSFSIPDQLVNTLEICFLKKKTLWLKGDSNTGKSQFLKSYCNSKTELKPFLVINDLNSITRYSWQHNSLIFDDMDFTIFKKNLSREVLIKLLDSEEQTTFDVKHGSISLRENVFRFIISNKLPSEYFNKNLLEQPEIQRRLIILDLGNTSLIKV
jgi:hypothetical protein